MFYGGDEVQAREAKKTGGIARLCSGEAVEKVEGAVGGSGGNSAVGKERKLLCSERVEGRGRGGRYDLAGTDLSFEREEEGRVLQPEIRNVREWKARGGTRLDEAVVRLDELRSDGAVVVASHD